MPKEPHITVVLAYIERDGSVLLTRRPPGVHQAGRWEFPGGKVETDESFSTALQRELCEEIGVTVAINDALTVTRYRYPDRTVELHLFRCDIRSGEPVARQVAEIRWVPKCRLCAYNFPPANAALLRALDLPEQTEGEPSCQKE